MKVLKFGGTSVGTVESLTNVKKIVESIEGPSVTVVSALGGLTDRLIATARMAAEGDEAYKAEMEAIRLRHRNIIDGVVDESKRELTHAIVAELLDNLSRLYDGLALIGDLPEKTLDAVVSFGERMSSHIVTAMIEGATRHDSMEFVKTEKWFNKNIADSTLTNELIFKEFSGKNFQRAIVPGFISTDRDSGEITNLGRGGSDFTAALIAAALDADVLEIWTDVDGFMTADPRIIKGARVIPEMSFVESMELCSYGAKVIYPPTIYPVFHKNIPIKILNTFNPTAPGTFISDRDSAKDTGINDVTGISAVRNTSLITLRGAITSNVATINTRTFNCLARKGVSVLLVSQPDHETGFSFALSNADAETARQTLLEEFAPELADGSLECIEERDDLSTIAVVGDHLGSHSGITARMSNTLLRAGIEVAASCEGTSSTTVTLVIGRDDTDEAMRLIHSLFFPVTIS